MRYEMRNSTSHYLGAWTLELSTYFTRYDTTHPKDLVQVRRWKSLPDVDDDDLGLHPAIWNIPRPKHANVHT